jgi:hypothetical protein
MEFVQLIEFNTSHMSEIQELDREWEKATEGKRTARRSVITRDRNDPNRHVVIVFFDSYESAMQNSALPETHEFAQRQGALIDGSPVFYDLDVIDDRA